MDAGRRRLLGKAGRAALVAPPAVTLLLTSGGARPAWASGLSRGGGSRGRSASAPNPPGKALGLRGLAPGQNK